MRSPPSLEEFALTSQRSPCWQLLQPDEEYGPSPKSSLEAGIESSECSQRFFGWESPVLKLSSLAGLSLLVIGAVNPSQVGKDIPWGLLGSALTSVVALIVGILAHLRATRAQAEQVSIDRDTLINEAYQDVLRELRDEVNRLHTTLDEERGRHEQRVSELKRRIHTLEGELREERDQRIALEVKVDSMETELSRVEKRGTWRQEEE